MRQVAALLQVSTATVYKLIDQGRLPAVRVAGCFLRVRRGEVARLAE